MQPPGFKTRFASARNLGGSNQWAADAAVSRSTELSAKGRSSAEPFLQVQQTRSNLKLQKIFCNKSYCHTHTVTCMWCCCTLAQLWPPPVETHWYRCLQLLGSMEPAAGNSDLSHIPDLLPARVAAPSEGGNRYAIVVVGMSSYADGQKLAHFCRLIRY